MVSNAVLWRRWNLVPLVAEQQENLKSMSDNQAGFR